MTEDNLKQYIEAFKPITSRVRTDKTAIKVIRNGKSKSIWTPTPLTDKKLIRHLSGGKPRGVCPIKEGETTTMVGLLDFDSHKGATSWDGMVKVAKEVKQKAEEKGLHCNFFRSSGGNGIHAFIAWKEPKDAYSVRMLLRDILAECGYKDGTKGVANKQIEIFPKQNKVLVGKCGNQFILPLAGQSLPLDPKTLEVKEKEYFLTMPWPISNPVPQLEMPIINTAEKPKIDDRDIKMIPEMLKCIDAEDYYTWTTVGMALHNIYGGSAEGMELWDSWSKTSAEKYKGIEEIEKKWATFANHEGNKVSIGTLKKLAYEGGWSENVADLFDTFEDENIDKKPIRFELKQAGSFAKANNISWAVKHVLPKTGVAMIYGESGSGKSFLALDICLSIARGSEWNFHKVKSTHKVAYIAAEGVVGIGNRLKAYAKFYGIGLEQLPLYIIDESLKLHNKDDDKALIKAIQAQGGIDVVVLDTLAQVTPGANENSADDMGAVMKRCQNIMDQIPCLVIIIHHSGKDFNRGARGWSGMKAAVDTEIVVTRDSAQSVAKISKQKDGESGGSYPFELEKVVIGYDEDGDDITSCVVKYVEKAPEDMPAVTGKWQIIIMDAFNYLILGPDDAVSQHELVEEAMKLALSSSDFDNPKEIRKGSVSRALDTLIKKGVLISSEEGIKLPIYN